MGKPYGVDGSSTSHGGQVKATQTMMTVDGIPYLRLGDGFACPRCKVWSVLVEPDALMNINGKPAVLVGARFSCGATLLPRQGRSVQG